MNVSIELPDSSRRILETLALDGYRNGDLSRGQVSEMLDLSFEESEQLLRKHNLGPRLTLEEHDEQLHRLRKSLGR